MLSIEQKKSIPKTTRHYWRQFEHKNYDGFELVEDYIADFNHIKDVLTKKNLKSALRFICRISNGYEDILSSVQNNKKLLRQSAERIVLSVNEIAKRGNVTISKACRVLNISKSWYYRQINTKKCSLSLTKKCVRSYPNQLTKAEVDAIEKTIVAPENSGKTKTTLYYQAIRKGIITCGKSTFCKYADLLGYKTWKKRLFPNKPQSEPKATRTFQWLHVDVTHIQTQLDGIQKVAFVKDNYSGALLHCASTSDSANSQFIKDLFEVTFEKYGLLDLRLPINILSDGGPENKGYFQEWVDAITAPSIVTKITANTLQFPFSNNMSESTHRIYKSEFMCGKHSSDLKTHLKDLERFMIYYNQERYPVKHYGLSPKEVLEGKIPDKNQFTQQIKNAREQRIETNQALNQCHVLCFN